MQLKHEKIGVPELAKRLKVNAVTVRTLISAGRLCAKVEGRNLIVYNSDLSLFLGCDSLEWWTISEVAERLNVSKMTIRREIERGRLNCANVGRQKRISSKMLDNFQK